jgi:hypothetical protein
MANRYYGLLNNGTPENKRILEITMALDARQNVTNEPTYLWKVPLLTGSNRIKEGKAHTPLVGAGFAEMDEREPLQRPRGMVSSYIQPPNEFILSGTSASYPYYNANELKVVNSRKVGGAYDADTKREMTSTRRQNKWAYAPTAEDKERGNKIKDWIEKEKNLDKKKPHALTPIEVAQLTGAGPWSALASSGLKTGAKYGAKYGAQAVKTGIAVGKKGAEIAVMVAKNPAVQAVVSEIANDKDVQKAVVGQITELIKGKAAENVVEDAPVEGGRIKKGKSDGRAKRAEIVKRIMREKGLKMTDASSYVKKHNLY